MARLCVLREDLLLEMHGVYVEDIRDLDDEWNSGTDGTFPPCRNSLETKCSLPAIRCDTFWPSAFLLLQAPLRGILQQTHERFCT